MTQSQRIPGGRGCCASRPLPLGKGRFSPWPRPGVLVHRKGSSGKRGERGLRRGARNPRKVQAGFQDAAPARAGYERGPDPRPARNARWPLRKADRRSSGGKPKAGLAQGAREVKATFGPRNTAKRGPAVDEDSTRTNRSLCTGNEGSPRKIGKRAPALKPAHLQEAFAWRLIRPPLTYRRSRGNNRTCRD